MVNTQHKVDVDVNINWFGKDEEYDVLDPDTMENDIISAPVIRKTSYKPGFIFTVGVVCGLVLSKLFGGK